MWKLTSIIMPALIAANISSANDTAIAGVRHRCYEIDDPREKMNRKISTFNIAIYKTIIYPPLKAYDAVIPNWGKARVNSLLDNFKMPLTFVNNILQGDIHAAGDTLGRFITNTSLGIGGLFDIASKFDVPYKPQNFEDTLMYYGFSYGSYSITPILGPSTTRGTVSKVFNFFLDPVNWFIYAVYGLDDVVYYDLFVNANIVMRYNEVIYDYTSSSLDPYIKIRDSYIQYLENRNPHCKDQQVVSYSLDD